MRTLCRQARQRAVRSTHAAQAALEPTDSECAPWRLIKGMRNRIAHNYWTIDDEVVWAVVDQHAADLHRALADDIEIARPSLDTEGTGTKS